MQQWSVIDLLELKNGGSDMINELIHWEVHRVIDGTRVVEGNLRSRVSKHTNHNYLPYHWSRNNITKWTWPEIPEAINQNKFSWKKGFSQYLTQQPKSKTNFFSLVIIYLFIYFIYWPLFPFLGLIHVLPLSLYTLPVFLSGNDSSHISINKTWQCKLP